MSRYLARITPGLLIPALLAAPLLVAEEASPGDYSPGDSVPLDEGDLRMITLLVLERTPLLSSSPGIKSAWAYRSARSSDIADIVFHPHAESAGIKHAFRVHCRRPNPDESWTCGEVRIRRYVQLESQEFEVRVVGDIGIEEALALIQATRRTAQASASDGSPIPETAIIIVPVENGYQVGWGSDDGQQTLSVEAHLKKDGNPAEPDDWQTRIFQPKE